MNLKQSLKKVKMDLVFFVVGFLIFPLVVIGAIYTIFRVQNDIEDVVSFPMDAVSIQIEEVPTAEPSMDLPEPTPNEMTSSITTVRTGHSQEGLNKSLNNQAQIEENGVWLPTQYEPGDIERNIYVVQLGDTLWQIASGYYGTGIEWSKILSANSNQIGFLPSGEQALIYPGQILTLP